MNRRALLCLGLALPVAGCGLTPPPPLVIACDPDLAPTLERAARAWPKRRGAAVEVRTDISERELGQIMEGLRGGLIATREPKQANRIQRLGLARLEHRWTRDIGGTPVALVVTRGPYDAEHQAIAFAKWLAGPDADRVIDPPGGRSGQPA